MAVDIQQHNAKRIRTHVLASINRCCKAGVTPVRCVEVLRVAVFSLGCERLNSCVARMLHSLLFRTLVYMKQAAQVVYQVSGIPGIYSQYQ